MKISIVIPSFNYGRFLTDAIDSAKNQEVEAEIVVQDNESTDETLSVLQRPGYVDRWESTRDSGQSDALNRAIAKAEGEWIAWLNADEFYLPGGLASLLEHATRTGAAVAYGDAVFVDEAGRMLRLLPQHDFDEGLLRRYGVIVPSCSAIFRRDVLGTDPFDTRFRGVMDLALLLRLAREGATFSHTPYPVGAFRVHDARVTAAPVSSLAPEFALLTEEFGSAALHRPRFLGRTMHGWRKLVEGAYLRQWRARRCKGRDLRWFALDRAPGWDCLMSSDRPGAPYRRRSSVTGG